ncbi:uncharacterized protein LOC143291388 [Babylonia areolata]|uniref:uncharacterized protein LOC143291388 n=1 Tax=Babylonia areolata TaxID=304850 RepID=UPI003FD5396A
MAVRLLMGKRGSSNNSSSRSKAARNGYRLHEYNNHHNHHQHHLHHHGMDGGLGYRDSYSDDEDDVFVEEEDGEEEEEEDGVGGPSSGDGLAGLSKPLMHPRHRATKVKSRTPQCKCRSLCKLLLTCLLAFALTGSLVSLILYTFNKHPGPDQSGTVTQGAAGAEAEADAGGGGGGGGEGERSERLMGCDQVEVEDVWVVGFPKLLTESAFRLVDVNQDGVLDVILGFATGADGLVIPPIVCDIYFNGSFPCFGGLLALEGLTGRELWRHYAYHELFALNCNVDLDGDGVKDCLGGGRAAAFEAVSCKEGRLLWRFEDGEVRNRFSNVYTPQFVHDMDGDHVPDILIVHGGDPIAQPHSKTRESARIALMSGRTGRVLRWMVVPEGQESYYSPQVYRQADGTQVVLFGTGGETHGGSLWVITLDHLKEGRIDMARAIYTDRQKGVMTPPVLVDVTGDGTVDIVMNPFNSSVIALDGRTYSLLWNRSFPLSESYSTPGAGYYNEDDIPDFLVKAAFGPGYPVYYHAETTVLDGRTGEPLVKPSVRVSVGAQSSALSVSMEGKGHDLFLYWIADCLGHEGEGGEYRFVNGTNVHEQSRSDFCQLRFQTKLYTKMLALSRAIPAPGATVYFSEERRQVERQHWVNTTLEAQDFLRRHPDILKEEMERNSERNLALAQLSASPEQGADFLRPQPPRGRARGGDANNDDNDDGDDSEVYPVGKKGPSLALNGGRPLDHHLHLIHQNPSPNPQRRPPPSRSRPLPLTTQQQQQARRPYDDKYSLYPFDIPSSSSSSSSSSSYGLKDADDSSAYRPGDLGGQGAPYGPYSLSQGPEYPGYYSSGDRYRLPSPAGYPADGGGYQPYKNYFQKRNYHGDVQEAEQEAESDGSGGRGLSGLLHSFFIQNHGSRGGGGGGGGDSRSRSRSGSGSELREAIQKQQGTKTKTENGGTKPKPTTATTTTTTTTTTTSSNSSKRKNTQLSKMNFMKRKKRRRRRRSNSNSKRSKREEEEEEAEEEEEEEEEESRTEQGGRTRRRDRHRRHVGPHDDNGLQRLLSTGTLAPSSLPEGHPHRAHSLDLVFATYWFFPARTRAILPRDQRCIDRLMAQERQRFDPKNEYYGMDHDAYGHEVIDVCLRQSQHQLSEKGVYESLNTYDPFNVHMGQMTVYRLRLKCTCSQVTNTTTDKRCARVLPFDQQRWPAYLGRHGDSFWLNDT